MIFLILAPFVAFAMLMLVTSASVSLFSAGAIALAIIGYDLFRGASIKMLMAGSTVLFASLGCYDIFSNGHWSGIAVRAAVDSGALAIALFSIAIRVPFTLQYARENVDLATRQMPGFMRANYIITLAWTGAFVLMLLSDLLMILWPNLPLWVGVAIAFAARNSAVYFTRWYPKHRRAMRESSGLGTAVES
jgi:hypothetical protein